MRAKKVLLSVMLFFMGSFIFGCSVRAGHLPPVSPWPPEPELLSRLLTRLSGKRSISIVVSGNRLVNGKEGFHVSNPKLKEFIDSYNLKVWQENTVKAYRDSGLFSEVKIGAGKTDLRAEVKFTQDFERNLPELFLTLFTAFIIPANRREEIFINTTITDQEGKILGTFEKSETITDWITLFLVLYPPIYPPFNDDPYGIKLRDAVLYDLNRATIIEAHSNGFL